MLLNCLDLLSRVIVEDAKEVIIGANNNPLLPCNELGATHGRVRDLNRTHLCLRVVIVDHDGSAIKCGEHPRKSRVQVDRLDSVRSV